MSASSIVMNCDDLRNQIFSYAFHQIPEECENCYCENIYEKTKLYLYKTTGFSIRRDFRDIDEFETYLQSSNKPSVKTTSWWYCAECFRKVVASNHDLIISNKIYDELKRQNPLMEHKKLLKQKEKYVEMVLYDDYEKKHRIKKTNELVLLFRNMMLDVAVQGFKEKKQKDENDLINCIERKREGYIDLRKKICRENSFMFVKEILMIKVNKLFYHKKINVNLFYISIEVIQNMSAYHLENELKNLLQNIQQKYRYRMGETTEIVDEFIKTLIYDDCCCGCKARNAPIITSDWNYMCEECFT